MRIAVIGAGKVAHELLGDLLSGEFSKSIDKIIVVSKSAEHMEKIIECFKDERLETERIDAKNVERISELLKKEKVDVCANVATHHVNLDVMSACLNALCAYIDAGGLYTVTLEQKKLHGKFIERGIPAILGLGAAPGASNVLVKLCADQLEWVEEIALYDAFKFLPSEPPIFIPPYSIETLIEEYTMDAPQFIDGEIKFMPAQSGEELITLPEPLGKIKCIHTIHSECATIPSYLKHKGLKKFVWKLGLAENVDQAMRILTWIGFKRKPLAIDGAIVDPIRVLYAVIEKNIEENREKISEVKVYSIIRVIANGEKGGKKVRCTVDLHRPPGTFLTGQAISIGIQMLSEGEIPPGVWAPEECIDPMKFLLELKKRGYRVFMTIEEEL